MNTIVIYKSKYGSTKCYAEWIAEELSCEAVDAKKVKADDLLKYDTIIYGGGLYAEMIAGITLITKNFEKIKDKNIIVFSTGITPLSYTEYYNDLMLNKNFRPYMLEKIKVFNFMGKMIVDELSPVHKLAIKSLQKLMAKKENPTEMEKLLVDLCDADGDFTDRTAIKDLVEYVKKSI
ncbi:MAG: flavodoxin domain-containing protein [Monoglobales bacterium]